MNLQQKIRQFLKENDIDYLLVNSTNEFLVEYNSLQDNSRYLLTGFSGSSGDALISQENIFLFTDGRYHQQADSETDKSLVTNVKLKLGDNFLVFMNKKIKKNKTFAIVAKKNSQARLEILQRFFKDKNITIKILDFDPIQSNKKPLKKQVLETISTKITGLSADEKFERLSLQLDSNQAFLTTNLEEISYFCNLRDFSQNYSSKINRAKALVTKDCAYVFLDDEVYIGENFKVNSLNTFEAFIDNLNTIDEIFLDKISTNIYDFSLVSEKVSLKPFNHLKDMKSIKTKEEIEHYKNCFERTDKAILETAKFIENNENISEYDIYKNLESNFYKFGAKSLSFQSIIAKDENSALAHYSKNSKAEIIKDGSLILIDCGAYFEGGYATDCTRVFVKNEPNKKHKTIYTFVLKAFLKAFNKKISERTSGFALDKAARNLLKECKLKGFEFSHSLGHGIGINVHEAPPSLAFSPLAKTPLKENMCFTIEPGLYKKGEFGVRLENTCYLAKEGEKFLIKSFTKIPYENKLIDFSLLNAKEKKQLKALFCDIIL